MIVQIHSCLQEAVIMIVLIQSCLKGFFFLMVQFHFHWTGNNTYYLELMIWKKMPYSLDIYEIQLNNQFNKQLD